MLSWRHLAALRELEARLRGSGVRWALTGTASFALQGMPVDAHDIDVQTDAAGAYALAGRFAKAVTRPVTFSEAGRIRSHFGALRLYGVTVEIMGDIAKRLPERHWEEPVDLDAHTRFVEAHGLRLPVLALEYEAAAYRTLGRIQTAEMLESWLAAHRTSE
jgi:aminoglycoside-2''-adenylyltransferase